MDAFPLRRLRVMALCLFLVLPPGIAGAVSDSAFSLVDGPQATDLVAYFKETGRLEPAGAMAAGNRFYPVFVFIPGIMGSKLEMEDPAGSGKYRTIWGRMAVRDMFIDSTDLHYDPALKDRIRATPLHDFTVMRRRTDIYGDFSGTMAYLDWTGLPHFFSFAYDWRQDNRTSAKDFDDKIRSDWRGDLNGRPVVVIAHSMGGLVFKWWYWHFYKGNETDYGFSIDNVFFLGTPHGGSPAALAAICEGYSLLAQSGSWMQLVDQNTLSRPLNNSGFTFPSIYQLIPADEQRATYVDQGIPNFAAQPVNLFSAEIWKRQQWPKQVPLNVSRDGFYASLQGRLDQALAFVRDIRRRPMIANAYYVYSYQYETPVKMTITRDEQGRVRSRIELKDHGGDGTVPVDIAKNSRARPHFSQCIRLESRHMDLPKDEVFLLTVADARENRARDRQKTKRIDAAAREIERDRGLAQAFADRRLLLAMPLKSEESEGIDRTAVATANNIIFALAHPELTRPEQFDRKFYATARNAPDPKTRSHLYATYLESETKVTGDGAIYKSMPVRLGWAANNLGHNLLLTRYWTEAGAYFKAAADYADRLKITAIYRELKTRVMVNRTAAARAVALELPGPVKIPGGSPMGGPGDFIQ